MPKTIIVVTVAALVLAGVIVKVLVAPSETVAGVETKSPIQNTVSIDGLHAGHPNIKNLSVQEAPAF